MRGTAKGCTAGALLAASVLVGCPAWADSGADGADGAGHDGTTGDAGGAGGAARTISAGTGDVILGAGNTDTGGAGGGGRGLTAADARSFASSTPGIDGTVSLAGQAGIAAGDSFDVTVDGVTKTITIQAGETLSDIAADVVAAFPTLEASATATGSNDLLTISQGATVLERFTLNNNNNTPLTALAFLGPFPSVLRELFADGGAGVAGGVAVVLDATSDDTLVNLGTIIGGNGGDGGGTLYRDGDGGDGGDGGAGVRGEAGSTANLVNRGTIAGGAGGTRGAGGVEGTAGSHGAGGFGVTGAGMTVTNSGTITGGLGGDGTTRADAVRFTGGVNALTLEAGSTITGNVVAFSTADTLALGGSANASFDVSQIGAAAQYRGFGLYRKTGSGTWTLTGTTGAATPWTLSAGTLGVGADGALGANTGALTFDGGRLQWGASFDLSNSRTVTLGAGGGTLDTNGFASTLSQDIAGTGALAKAGAGTLVMTGNWTHTGGTTVELGTLAVNGSITGSVTVEAGGTLAGSGTLGDTVVASGGILAPGSSVGTLTVSGDLALNSGSILEFELGAPGSVADPAAGVSDRMAVSGDLTLDGTLNLAQSDDAGDGTAALGYYRLLTYGGGLTDNGLAIGSTPALADPATFNLQAGGGKVDLFVAASGDDALQTWQGGDGSWSDAGWINQGGGATVAWVGNHALFRGGSGGTITVTGTPGFKGLQFVDDGYRLAGDGRLVVDGSERSDGNAEIRVLAERAEIAAEIAGSGGITKTQGGRLVLSGRNSYRGGTRLVEGTVEVASDSGLGDSSGGLTFTGGTLATTASFDSTRGVTMTGAGSFEVAGGTRLGLTGELTGAGDLAKAGEGTLRFDGDGSGFTGTTRVAGGLLSVGGRLGGTVVVVSGGTLGGDGRVGATTVSSGGTLAPGNSIGTLTVEGDVTFEPGSRYAVEVDPGGGDSDLVRASGRSLLNGASVFHVGLPGGYAPLRTYTILLAAGGIEGRFSGATSAFPFLTAALSHGAQSVELVLSRNDVPFAVFAETPNQAAVAAAADGLGEGDAVQNAILGLFDAAAIRGAFDALSGEIHASTRTVLLDDSRFLRAAVSERLRAASGESVPANSQTVLAYGESGAEAVPADSRRFAAWGQAYGSWATYDGDGGSGAGELDRSTGGVFLGADAPVLGEDDPTRLGVTVGWGRSSLSLDGRGSEATVDSYSLGAYAGTEIAGFALRLGAAHSWHEIDSERSVAFAGFSERSESEYQARTAQVFGEVGYAITRGRTSLEPFAGLAWVHLASDGFEEDGAAGLEGEGEDSDLAFGTLGLRAATGFRIAGMAAALHAAPGWRHAFGEVAQDSTLAFAGGDPFTVTGVPLARDAAVLDAGLALAIAPNASLGLSYRGQVGAGVRDHGLDASLQVRF